MTTLTLHSFAPAPAPLAADLQSRFFSALLPMMTTTRRILAVLGLALFATLAMAQQRAGEITHLQGLATAGPAGGTARFLGVGDPVFEGDVITTTDKGYAIVALADGSKFTLRPSTTFAVEKFSHNPQGAANDDALGMRLFKGGMRMITGLVGKRNPNAVEMRTATATIGIRGTSFDARLCGDDCRAEGITPIPNVGPTGQPAQGTPAQPQAVVVARVVQVSGTATATLRGAAARTLGQGAPLYEGDEIRTAGGATAVIGFRDQTRVSVNPNTVFRIDAFLHNTADASKDNVALALFKGGMRAFTGLIGKSRPDGFTIKTATSTIGIRGTGMDISCEGPCVDNSLGEPPVPAGTPGAEPVQTDGLFMLTWDGLPYFLVGQFNVPLNQTGFIGRDGQPRLLPTNPAFMLNFAAARPDQVEINWDNLFATVIPGGADGLYVSVRDGHVFLLSGSSRIDLGVGESGYVGALGVTQRLTFVPRFLLNDAYPLPEQINRGEVPIFQLFGVTLGAPGQEMCRL